MDIKDLDNYALSPLNIVDTMFRDLRDKKGEAFVPVDASNPVFHLYEMAGQLHADSNRRLENTDKRHYSVMGETEEELYAGMFGVDYLDRFASPGATTLTIRIPIDEIVKHAATDTKRNLKTLVIGKDSSFTAQNLTCTLAYPIEIRLLPSNGIQVVWDLSKPNPLDVKESEQIEYRRYYPNGYKYEVVDLIVPIKQFKITSATSETGNGSFNERFQFPDQLYHVKVAQFRNDTWVDVETTHSALTYDPNNVTAVLRRIDNELEVWIPQIYFEKGIVSSPIKVDILSTLGGEERSLTDFELGQWSYSWQDLDAVSLPSPMVAMSSLNAIQVFATSDLRGGTPEKTLAELRERKLKNVKQRTMPIMGNEITSKATDMGYDVKLIKDAIGDRNYWLSRALPEPVISSTTGAGADSVDYALTPINSALVTMSKTLSELRSLDQTVWSGDLLTIHSRQAWLYNAGLMAIPKSSLDTLKADKDKWVKWLNENNLVYSPYYYSLDNEGQYLSVKVYDMDNPETGQHRFIQENAKTNLMCSTGTVRVVKVSSGYVIYLSARRSENLAELDPSKLNCQLSMTPVVGGNKVYLAGSYLGEDKGELVYQFKLKTDLLIYPDNYFKIAEMMDTNGAKWDSITTLNQVFDLHWVVDNGENKSSFERDINRRLFGDEWSALTKESLEIQFGEHLPHVYCNHRRTVPEYKYQTYDHDVLAVYEESVPKRDPVTKLPVGSWVDDNWVQEWLHVKGDPVIDPETGEQKVLKRAGIDPILKDGEPIILNEGDTGFILDLLVLEGGYKSITETVTETYYRNVLSTLKAYIAEDLPTLKNKLLPNTSAFFSPKASMGTVPVSVVTGETVDIQASQEFKIRVYLTSVAYEDLELRLSLEQAIHKVLHDHVKQTTVSISKLTKEISDLSSDVITVGIDLIDGKFESIKMTSEAKTLTLAKEYFVTNTGEIDIRDKIEIAWTNHGV